jgi:glycogen debranching enzyme
MTLSGFTIRGCHRNRSASLRLGVLFLLAVGLASSALRSADAQENVSHQSESSPLVWDTLSTRPMRFIGVHGRRAAILGYSETGLEIWAYPIQILKAYRPSFRLDGTTSEIDGLAILRRITYSSESVTRIYVGTDFIVREILFVPLDQAGAVVTYDVESSRPVDIVLRFTPVLDLMWPAALGGQEVNWDNAASAYVFSEPTYRFAAAIASPNTIAHDETPNATQPPSRESGFAFTIRAGGKQNSGTAEVTIAAGTISKDAISQARNRSRSYAALEREAAAHYAELQTHSLQIQTPDPDVNRAVAWSEVALDQAWVCNADLGCGLVGGYGPSRKARRPQYAWFFAGDALVAIRALLSTGQFSRAREVLEFIIKYQDPKNGMIWHELSQSAGVLDWAGKYPYMYVHVDITFQYLNVVRDYFTATGDEDFLKAHWASVQAAYDYCRSLLDPSDGLPRIPATKEGENEQDSLSDDLRLSASWVEAAGNFAHLAAFTGHSSEAAEAELAGRKAVDHIAQRYWSPTQHFWISGYSRSGAPVIDRDIGPSRVLAQNLFNPAERDSILDQLSSSHYQTDWGTRSIPDNASVYDPNSYSKGSVWGISTAGIASALWTAHRPATAFPVWNSLVPWTSFDSLGHIHETLAGNYYHEEEESVPEQTWSSAAFLTSTVHGLLGLEVGSESREIVFSPHLPATWGTLTIRNVAMRESRINLSLTRSDGEISLYVQNDGPSLKMRFAPEIPLGARLLDARLENKRIAASVDSHRQDNHAKVEFQLPHGNTKVSLRYVGGVSLIVPSQQPKLGDPSRGIKVTGVKLDRGTYTIDADFVPYAQSTLELKTPWSIQSVQGATLEHLPGGLYQLKIKLPEANSPAATYHHATVVVNFSAAH